MFHCNYVMLYLAVVILTDTWHHSCVVRRTAEHVSITQSVKRSKTFMFLILAVIYFSVHFAFVRGKPTTNGVQQWSLGLTWIETPVVKAHQINPHIDTGQKNVSGFVLQGHVPFIKKQFTCHLVRKFLCVFQEWQVISRHLGLCTCQIQHVLGLHSNLLHQSLQW